MVGCVRCVRERRCDVSVFFSGCAVCGHLFYGSDWEHLPTWDPGARERFAIDAKNRIAARLLAAEVKT